MSIEAMKQAVATFEKIVDGCNGIDEGQDVHSEAKKVARLVIKDCLPALKALRQALAQPEQEPLGGEWVPCVKLPVIVHVRNQRDGENHISTREGITPVLPDDLIMRGVAGEEYPIGRELFERTYTFDVDAVNMTPDRVDETAKGEHVIDCTDEQLMEEVRRRGFVIRDAQIGREWVGLTDDEVIKCFDSVAFGQVEDDLIINKHVNIFRVIHGIEAKLKEKNNG